MSLASWGTSAFKEDAIMSEKPQCFIECLIPSTVCNLKCSHCYVIQRHGNTQQVPELSYPVDRIKRALTKDRFGGGGATSASALPGKRLRRSTRCRSSGLCLKTGIMLMLRRTGRFPIDSEN